MSNTTFLSVPEAANILDCSEQYVRKAIREGDLSADRVGKNWVIPEDALETFHTRAELVKEATQDHKRYATHTPKTKALSFFSGALGLDIGLEKAGIEIMLASEIDKACRKTITHNKPEIGLIGDIRDYTATDIRKYAGLTPKDDIDLIVGGPPCQAFSTAGKRKGFEDHRGNVFLTFIERIIELQPKFAVIENVRGLLSAPLKHRPHEQRGPQFPPLTLEEQKGGALMYILQILKNAGYSYSFNLYNAANFGSPQKRERVIICCSRDGIKLPYLVPTHSETGSFGLPPWKTLREALKGLPKKNHTHVNFPEKRLRFYRLLKAGENWRNLSEDLQKEALGASYYAGGGKTGFFRRLAWDKPSPTLVTHPAMPATDLAHPTEDRPLSIQEYKRIQEFPDDWVIEGSIIDQYRQIGNAVPSSLGQAIGNLIVSHLKNKKIKNIPDFQYSRYKDTDDTSWVKTFNAQLQSKEQLELSLEF